VTSIYHLYFETSPVEAEVACNVFQLLRLGVDEFRYVATSAATCWLITIDKNTKGRGHMASSSQVVTLCTTVNIYIFH